MKRDIDCIGFKAPENLVDKMRDTLSELQSESPSDSYVVANIRKEGKEFVLLLSVRYQHGEFKTQVNGFDINNILDLGMRNMNDQLDSWKRERTI